MKLPAVAMAALFACGIAFGLCPPIATHADSRLLLLGVSAFAGILVLAGFLFAMQERLRLAAASSILCWISVGVLAAAIAEQPLPNNHITAVMDAGRLDLHSPLKWFGWLRDDPAKLPWGYSYEIELSGVMYRGEFLSTRGGLRLTFAPRSDEQPPSGFYAGDQIAVLTQAKRPQVFRDPGAFDRRAYLATQNIDLLATLRAPELLERVAPSPPSIGTFVAHARARLRDEVDVLFSAKPEVAAVLRAMLLGDRSFVDREEAADFQKTGSFHVLVVAGLHVGALAVFLYWLGRKLRLTPVATILLILALLGSYVAVVEQRPPVLRAGLMAAIVVLGALFYRRLNVLNSAGVAALVLLMARPLALGESSFQLTFLAIGCIAGLALPWLARTLQPYARALRGWRDVTRDAAHEPRVAQFRIDLRSTTAWLAARVPQRLAPASQNILVGILAVSFRVWALLVLTVALQIGMLPLMARDFHRITLSAPFVNVLAVPLTGIIVPLGFATLASAWMLPALGKLFAVPLSWLTLTLLEVVRWFAHLPHWSYRIPGPHAWLIAIFLLIGVSLAVTLRLARPWTRKGLIASATALLACSALIALHPFAPEWSHGKLEFTVLDVGQGDSLLVVSPGGKTLLIDGGGAFGGFSGQSRPQGIDPGEEAVSAYLWSRRFQKLDVVALTHAHHDHIGGLAAILENFQLGCLWIGHEVNSAALLKLESIAREKHIPIEHESQGHQFAWDALRGDFFWPEGAAFDPSAPPRNNDSLVLRLQYGERAALLPGDAEKEAERQILAENARGLLHADILKIGHHGSKNSTIPEFLAAVRPGVAIISVGEDNPYGHPSPELLERLKTAGIRILRTDRDGAVQILTDGHSIELTCFVDCSQRMDAVKEVQVPHDLKQEPPSIHEQAQAPNYQQNAQQQ